MDKTCAFCSDKFQTKSPTALYCSSKCKKSAEGSRFHKRRKEKLGIQDARHLQEARMKLLLDKIFVNVPVLDNRRYKWLIGPNGGLLELDRYYPTLKLAFEYQGIQHYDGDWYSPEIRGHNTRQNNYGGLKYTQECDRLKREQCIKEQVTLVEVPYSLDLTEDNIKDLITKVQAEKTT